MRPVLWDHQWFDAAAPADGYRPGGNLRQKKKARIAFPGIGELDPACSWLMLTGYGRS
jgi:hypothetical protein